MQVQRVLIVGISATGKTRLAQLVANKLSLPVILLDSIFWKKNWQEQDPKVVKTKIHQAIQQDKWVIEGYIEPLSAQRVKRANKVIYLDLPGYMAFWGGLKRWRHFKGKARPEMPAGNIETLGWKFLMMLLSRAERPEIEAAIKGYESKVVRLKSWRAANAYLKRM